MELENRQEATMGHTWCLCFRTVNDGNSDSWSWSPHPDAPLCEPEINPLGSVDLRMGALQHEMEGPWLWS